MSSHTAGDAKAIAATKVVTGGSGGESGESVSYTSTAGVRMGRCFKCSKWYAVYGGAANTPTDPVSVAGFQKMDACRPHHYIQRPIKSRIKGMAATQTVCSLCDHTPANFVCSECAQPLVRRTNERVISCCVLRLTSAPPACPAQTAADLD